MGVRPRGGGANREEQVDEQRRLGMALTGPYAEDPREDFARVGKKQAQTAVRRDWGSALEDAPELLTKAS